jgi:phage/plasmid-like protein (TIGR03299 family)
VRVICQNTLNAALGNTISRVAIRHTSNAKKKLEEAHKLMGISHKFVEELNECFNVLATKKITDAQVLSLIEELFKSGKKEEVEGDENKEKESTRILNIRAKVWEAYQTGVGQDAILGTAWGAYNGITHYLDHSQNYKSGDVKFDSIISGAGYKIATNALNALVKL